MRSWYSRTCCNSKYFTNFIKRIFLEASFLFLSGLAWVPGPSSWGSWLQSRQLCCNHSKVQFKRRKLSKYIEHPLWGKNIFLLNRYIGILMFLLGIIIVCECFFGHVIFKVYSEHTYQYCHNVYFSRVLGQKTNKTSLPCGPF